MPVTINTECMLYNQPIPVSLPYTLPRLPTLADFQARKDSILKHKDQLENLIEEHPQEQSEETIEAYNEWFIQVQRLNPGFSSANSVMTPTSKLTDPKTNESS